MRFAGTDNTLQLVQTYRPTSEAGVWYEYRPLPTGHIWPPFNSGMCCAVGISLKGILRF